jgi:hypothetical protein
MACKCDSCSSPRIIKTRTALYWRWVAQSRGETADRVILAPARAAKAPVAVGPTDDDMPGETADSSSANPESTVDEEALDLRRAEFLREVGRGGRI